MFSASAARSDEYVPVRAGSDLYVVLAMINEVISNDMINELYVKRHTTAPFLLRKDNGLILRQSDIEGGEMAGVRDAKTLTATGSIKRIRRTCGTRQVDRPPSIPNVKLRY